MWCWRGELAHQIPRPRPHQLAPLRHQIAATVGGFRLVADRVSERHFDDLGRERGALCRPITEGRPEPVDRVRLAESALRRALQCREHGVLRQRKRRLIARTLSQHSQRCC